MVLMNERLRSHASQLFDDSAAADGDLITPPIFVSEVDSMVCRREFSGELNTAEAQRAPNMEGYCPKLIVQYPDILYAPGVEEYSWLKRSWKRLAAPAFCDFCIDLIDKEPCKWLPFQFHMSS